MPLPGRSIDPAPVMGRFPRSRPLMSGCCTQVVHTGSSALVPGDTGSMGSESNDRRVAVIIEDDADIRDLLAAVLTQAGFETIPASNGLDGVRAVRENNPVVTTLDVSMTGINGFETARRIRSFSPTYLVMLTARSEEIDTLQGLESGADDYLTKPFRPRELRARIDAMLRRPRGDVPRETPVASTAPATSQDRVPAPPRAEPARASANNDWFEHNGLRLNSAERLVSVEGCLLYTSPSP